MSSDTKILFELVFNISDVSPTSIATTVQPIDRASIVALVKFVKSFNER